MKTMICLILDRSGSMQGRESDVVGGVNKFIEEQKALPDPASLAIVRFDGVAIERFRPMMPLSEVKPLRLDEYVPRDMTPLLDAVGQTITALDEDWKREQPDRSIVMIVTDGQENVSKEYTREQVKALISARQDSQLWAFIYLGANVDAFAEAGGMGIRASNVAGTVNSSAGIKHSYATSSESVKMMRATGSVRAHNLGVANLGEGDEEGPDVIGAKPSPMPQQDPVPSQEPAPAQPWTPPTGDKAAKSISAASQPWSPPL